MTSGGWKDSDRKDRLPSNWVGLRGRVIARAQGRCELMEPVETGGYLRRCWRRGTDVDHVEPGDNHDLANLQLLCKYHHGKKTAREGVEGRRRAPAKRAAEKHPGDRT